MKVDMAVLLANANAFRVRAEIEKAKSGNRANVFIIHAGNKVAKKFVFGFFNHSNTSFWEIITHNPAP